VLTSGSSPTLNQVAQSSNASGSSSGFFTSISSNGTSNAIIWALSRPGSPSTGNVHLYAFNPDSGSTLQPLFTASAGSWPNTTGNSNLVPVVANGEVFVASYQQLQVFGLNNPTTTTSLTSSANPSAYGQPVTLTAQVSSSGGSEPTGTVTFDSGSKVLGSSQLNSSGAATFALTTAQLPVGSQSFTASYGGDGSHGTSESNVLTQVVNQATISLTLTASPNPSPLGKSVKLTATVTSNGKVPSGTVTFSYNGATLGTSSISNGIASHTVTTLPAGSDVVTASFAGTVDFSSASGSVTEVVDSTTTTLTSSVNPSSFGQPVTLTAKVTNTSSTIPTGTVTFKNGSAIMATEELNASGVATFTASMLPVGSDSLTASYSGDAANSRSTSQAVTQVVNPATITITLTSSPNPSTSGQSVTFTATLTSTGSMPTGSVTFSSNGTTLGQKSIVKGVAAFSTKTLPQGTDAVTATFTGNTKYSSASATVNQTVN
jgi:Big-like domain-containing protein